MKNEGTSLEKLNAEIYSICGVPSELLNNNKSLSVTSAKLQLEIFKKKYSTDACEGYSYNTPDGVEYDCDYEFAGDVDCGDCIFGSHGGTQDPRIDSNIEEEED